MHNNGGPREAKRRLVANVVHSKLPSAVPVRTNALQNHAIQRKLFSAQRSVALRIVSSYRTVSTSAMFVLARFTQIDWLAEERQETFQLREELTCTDLQEVARAKKAIHKDGRHKLVEKRQMKSHGEQTGSVRGSRLLFGFYSLWCSSLSGSGRSSSHSWHLWCRRESPMGFERETTGWASSNRIEACTHGPASLADLTIHVVQWGFPPPVGVASRFA